MSDKLKVIEGLIRSEPLNYNFSVLDDRLKNAKASVDDYESLPMEGNEIGDYRLIKSGSQSGKIFWWTGENWNEVGKESDAYDIKYGSTNVMEALNTLFMSHISDFGTNDNGTYIKWANGFAVVFRSESDDLADFDLDNTINSIPMPIEFISNDKVAGGGIISSSWTSTRLELIEKTPLVYSTRTQWNVVFNHPGIDLSKINRRYYWAFGFWE